MRVAIAMTVICGGTATDVGKDARIGDVESLRLVSGAERVDDGVLRCATHRQRSLGMKRQKQPVVGEYAPLLDDFDVRSEGGFRPDRCKGEPLTSRRPQRGFHCRGASPS